MKTLAARWMGTSLLIGVGILGASIPSSALVIDERKSGCKTMVEFLYQGVLRRSPTAPELDKQTNACNAQLGTPNFTFYKDLAKELGAPNAAVPPSVYDLASWHYC